MLIDKTSFIDLYTNTLICYSEDHQKLFPEINTLIEELYTDCDEINLIDILDLYVKSNNYVKAIFNRILGVKSIIESRENDSKLDLKNTWKYISNSIKLIPIENTISSIGSQGFLSIPLYKKIETLEDFDFIRLHIWDESLNEYIDLQKRNDFSIHSHTFFAESWIITGAVINKTYDFFKTEFSDYSLFKVEYNKSLNKVNQHYSVAVNQNKNYKIKLLSDELHYSGGKYSIKAGNLHSSGHKNSKGTTATFFSFTGKKGLDESFVIGPKNIKESPINRNIYINPLYLLEKIENQIINE